MYRLLAPTQANAGFLRALKRSFDQQEWRVFGKGLTSLCGMATRKLSR